MWRRGRGVRRAHEAPSCGNPGVVRRPAIVLPQMYLEAGAIWAAPERGPEVAMPVVAGGVSICVGVRICVGVSICGVSYRRAEVPVVHIVEHVEVISDMTRVEGASPDRLSCVCAAGHDGVHFGVVSIEAYASKNGRNRCPSREEVTYLLLRYADGDGVAAVSCRGGGQRWQRRQRRRRQRRRRQRRQRWPRKVARLEFLVKDADVPQLALKVGRDVAEALAQ